jgi:hypothetical protein
MIFHPHFGEVCEAEVLFLHLAVLAVFGGVHVPMLVTCPLVLLKMRPELVVNIPIPVFIVSFFYTYMNVYGV